MKSNVTDTTNQVRIFVGVINNEGRIDKTITDYDFERFKLNCESTTKEYLEEYGYAEFAHEEKSTEDGYLYLSSHIPGVVDSEKYLGTYSFDGEMRIPDFFSNLTIRD